MEWCKHIVEESRKNGPRKIGPRETQKRKIAEWAPSIVVCVCEMLGCDQSMKTQNSTTNPKLENKKSWGERRASWCVCGMFRCDQSKKSQNSKTNTKLGNKPKTRKQKIVGWASSIVVCLWNVRTWSIYENPKLDNKPSWDSFSVLQFGAYVGWWRKRQTSFCVCSGVNR